MKEDLLEMLKSSEDYLSGELMSNSLGVSRAAIWKAIKQLKEQGYLIESKTKKGYKLIGTPDLLYSWELKNLLNTKLIGNEIIHLNNTTSTNDIAHKFAQEKRNEGFVIISEKQQTGRGRKSSRWVSPESKGIYMSLLLKPNISVFELPHIGILMTTAVCKALSEVTGEEINCRWPSEIIHNDKKLAGILIEFMGELEQINYVISGIGINVNDTSRQFEKNGINYSTSVNQISNIKQGRRHVVSVILNTLDNYYNRYCHGEYREIFLEYQQICTDIGKNVAISDGTTAKCIDITEQNQLVLMRQNGEILKQGFLL